MPFIFQTISEKTYMYLEIKQKKERYMYKQNSLLHTDINLEHTHTVFDFVCFCTSWSIKIIILMEISGNSESGVPG